jgi:hypothetical protein
MADKTRSFLLMVCGYYKVVLASTAAWILNDISTTCTNNALASLSVVLICGSPLSFSFLPVAHNVICFLGLFFLLNVLDCSSVYHHFQRPGILGF